MSSKLKAGTASSGAVLDADTTGILELQTGSTPATAVTIDTSQNVGIGTASPNAKLDIVATTNTIRFGRSTSSYSTIDSNSGAGSLSISADVGGLQTGGSMIFNLSGTERMRIATDGSFCVGTTTANGKVTINQTDTGSRTITASSPASYAATAFRSDSSATSGTGWYHLYGSSSGGSVNNIFIYGNGNIQNANNSYGAISDIKIKENIVDATPKLDKLMQVKVRNYNLKGDYEQHKQIGVIAQELETIFPSLIEETQDRGENDEVLETTTKSVKYSVFVPMLIKALQELNDKVDAQALEIQALKGTA